MAIPGLETLYEILRRNIERKNDVLVQRKELAGELVLNCRKWSRLLIEAFEQVQKVWAREGKENALKKLEEVIEDFLELDYWSLEETSPILRFLGEDLRFVKFVDSCARFYESSLHIKRVLYGSIEASPNQFVDVNDVGVQEMMKMHLRSIEWHLRNVSTEFMEIRTLTPK